MKASFRTGKDLISDQIQHLTRNKEMVQKKIDELQQELATQQEEMKGLDDAILSLKSDKQKLEKI